MSADERRRLRESWSVRIYRLGEEPPDDLSATTTPEERVRMVEVLSRRSWELSGQPLPQYPRSSIPITVLRRS
ncbi:MAG TPA: hypothetical protein VIK25_15340 [Gemmatimonadaceae bacterium]